MRRQINTTQREMRTLELIVDGTGAASLSGPASNQATLTDNGVGDYTITFDEPFGNTPVVMATPETTGVVCRVVSKTISAVNIECVGAASTASIPEQTASLTTQGLTLYSKLPGAAGNTVEFEKTVGGTAGNEVVTVTGTTVSVQIEDGVSTSTQIHAKLIASIAAMNLIAVVDSTPATANTAAVAAPLAGGVDAVAGANLSTAPTDADFHVLIMGSEVSEKY